MPPDVDITPGDFKELYGLTNKHAIKRLTHLVKARDVMTEKVIFFTGDISLEEVAHSMATHGITGVPVVDNVGKVVGVVSEKDFILHLGSKDTTTLMGVVDQCLRNKEGVATSMHHQKAEDIMTSPAITVREDVPVSEIANILTEKNISRVPVTDQEGKLLGIVAKADIVPLLCMSSIKTGDKK
jgi:CBS domain-containing protein